MRSGHTPPSPMATGIGSGEGSTGSEWGLETGYEVVNGLVVDTAVCPLVLGPVLAGRVLIESIDPMVLSRCRAESLAHQNTQSSSHLLSSLSKTLLIC